jgi:hypothetical protein
VQLPLIFIEAEIDENSFGLRRSRIPTAIGKCIVCIPHNETNEVLKTWTPAKFNRVDVTLLNFYDVQVLLHIKNIRAGLMQ